MLLLLLLLPIAEQGDAIRFEYLLRQQAIATGQAEELIGQTLPDLRASLHAVQIAACIEGMCIESIDLAGTTEMEAARCFAAPARAIHLLRPSALTACPVKGPTRLAILHQGLSLGTIQILAALEGMGKASLRAGRTN